MQTGADTMRKQVVVEGVDVQYSVLVCWRAPYDLRLVIGIGGFGAVIGPRLWHSMLGVQQNYSTDYSINLEIGTRTAQPKNTI